MNGIVQIQDAYFNDEISLLQAAHLLDQLGYNQRERGQILASMRRTGIERAQEQI